MPVDEVIFVVFNLFCVNTIFVAFCCCLMAVWLRFKKGKRRVDRTEKRYGVRNGCADLSAVLEPLGGVSYYNVSPTKPIYVIFLPQKYFINISSICAIGPNTIRHFLETAY